MNSYIQQLFPFVDMGDFIKNTTEVVDAQSIYCPVEFGISNTGNVVTKTQARPFNAYRIDPCGMLVVDEQDSILKDIKAGAYGDSIRLTITEMDYTNIASRIEVLDDVARVHMNQGYMTQNVLSDIFINSATNGFIITPDMIPDSTVKPAEKVSFKVWVDSMKDQVNESADAYKDLLSDMKSTGLDSSTSKKTDSVYQWLDAYFALPEGASTKARSEVPLLIGPTGVFKSSTIKELCKKYGYRLIDFRAAFTSRLDYSGLYQMGTVDDQLFSYSCPMEELVTCSDGFIEYCKRAYDKVSQILAQGYIVNDKTSNGEITEGSQTPLTDEQKTKLEGLLSKYKEYMKPVCLFVDEITRVKDSGVNGILTEMLNQKRFNNMPMKNCKFVAATNANLKSRTDQRHNDLMEELDDMYDVNDDLDIAFSNRFIPLLVRPEDVQDRWFEWATAKTKTSRDGLSKVDNIHPLIVEYLTTVGADQVYNDSPILDAIEAGLTDNETKSQPFPNYRTWEMVSNYLYTIDEEYDVAIKEATVEKDKNDVKKVYRPQIITGLISKQSGDRFITFLKTKGYISIEESLGKEVDDEYSDFLQTSLDAGVPALMVGPSSIGKTSRVEQYIKRQKDKTGLEPVLINIDLASKDAVDLMGMPAKLSLVDYVAGKDLEDMGLGDVKAELSETVRSVQSEDIYGLSDYLTVRSPDLDAKNALLKAKREGREIIFFFDECNRVKSSTVLSSMFECFTGDTKIKLLDGTSISMEEIYVRAENGDTDMWVYSMNDNGNFVPGRICRALKKTPTTEMIRVYFDNDTYVECTEDHRFRLSDGTYKEAKYLTEEDDIAEFEFSVSCKDFGDYIDGYTLIKGNTSDEWRYVHKAVSMLELGWSEHNGNVIHHKDFNKLNNNPDNLNVDMSYLEHITYHGNHLQEMRDKTDFEEKRIAGLRRKAKEIRDSGIFVGRKMSKDSVERSASTRKRLCEESEEYKNSLSAGFIRYNERVKSGEIERTYDHLKRENMSEERLERARKKAFDSGFIQAGIDYWKDESHRKKQSDFAKEYQNRPEIRKFNSDLLKRRNAEGTIKKQAKLGSIRKVVAKIIELYGSDVFISEELYNRVKMSDSNLKRCARYDNAVTFLSSIGCSFSDAGKIMEVSL